MVKEAYQKYENREFGPKVDAIHIDNRNRHVKLINFTDNEVSGVKTISFGGKNRTWHFNLQTKISSRTFSAELSSN